MAESITLEFITFYKNLSKAGCLCRVFERNDKFCLYGDDTQLATKVLTAAKLKTMGSGSSLLKYVNMTKLNLIQVLKYLLFVVQYKIEILRNVGTVRSPEWVVVGKASPGNLSAVEDLLFSDDNSYVMKQRGIMAIKVTAEGTDMLLGVGYCDSVLREIQICEFIDNPQLSILQSVLAQLSPLECLLPPSSKLKQTDYLARSVVEEAVKTHNISITEASHCNSQFIVQDLNRLLRFEDGQDFQNTMKDESDMKCALSSVAAIINYLELLSDENNFGQYSLTIFKSELYAKVDLSCEIGLGLFPEIKANFHEKTYLFGHLNTCFTSTGERLLMQWIKQPLMDVRKIEERLDIVEIFVKNIGFQTDLSKLIDKFIDVEMLCRKIQRRKANLQDLYKIYQMLIKLPPTRELLRQYSGPHEDILKQNFTDVLQERIEDFENFTSMISQTLDFDAIQNKEFVIKADYDETLLDIRKKMTKLKNSMSDDLDSVKKDLELPSLKLELFDKLGYTFRLTLKEESHLRNKKGYIMLDTRSSGVRFQSPKLQELNEQYTNLRKEYEGLQKKIVDQMVDVSASYIQPLKLLGSTVAWMDASLSLARVAIKASNGYVRPKLKAKGKGHVVLKQCRHPFLEETVRNYIPNDIEITMEKQSFFFVTGPNMGGKSTFIRSVALSVLLAQMGSFVPCEEADISVVDAFFTRIGAFDKPSKAMSTFMYEMLEVKNMIKCATSSSLLIIDEMGRGTSTYDGLGLSWAISRHIAEVIKSPCLFATHFHNLTTLSKSISSVGNLHVDALCAEGDVTFLYRVTPGVCNESFGIHVGKLAALPDKVIQHAQRKLKELESSHMTYKDISTAFSSIPKREVFIKAVEEVFPFDLTESKECFMEVDHMNEDDISDVNTLEIEDNHLSTKLEKCKQFLETLEMMENGMCKNDACQSC